MEKEQNVTTIGVVGQGSFGEFLLRALPDDCEIRTYDSARADTQHAASLDEVLAADVLIPAIPLFSYDDFFSNAADKIKPETLIIDVCSVKTTPAERVHAHLPEHPNLLMTHPLFGPQSVAESFKDHTLIVTESKGDKARKVIDYFRQVLGLRVMEMSAEEHDRTMAQVHVLTFFAARGLGEMKLPSVAFQTPSYNEILDLIALDHSHTDDLFRTIQLGNPYAKEMRQKFIAALTNVDEQLSSDE